MAWWGKLIGGAFGLMFGGPLGALIGGALGHGLDRGMDSMVGGGELGPGERRRAQNAFFAATFSVMGHLAKADGRVSEREIALAESVMARMELSPEMRRAAIDLFKKGKADGFALEDALERLRHDCRGRRALLQMFLEIQIQVAYADGRPGPRKEKILRHICVRMGIPEPLFRHLEQLARLHQTFGTGTPGDDGRARRRPSSKKADLDQAYAALGVERKATDAEIKRAYRRLLSQHHPDKLVSRGLPEEMMKLAAEKTHEIRQAYETITRARTT